jgi:hypothetical protein
VIPPGTPGPGPSIASAARTSILVLGLAGLGACEAALDDLADGLLVLPPELREVSAIAALDERTLACVQDEAGALFLVDLSGQRPPRVAVFGEPGDYEGLACVGDDYWVLRSDGLLLRLESRDGGLEVASTHRLPTEHEDWEGLCFDRERGVLLILPKDRVGKGKERRAERFVFAVDPSTGTMQPGPVLLLDVPALIEQAEERGLGLPIKTTDKGKSRPSLKLLGSEILAIPGTEELLLLSATDRALLRVDRSGHLLGLQLFDDEDLPKPEGMAWLPDGRLLVASEGTDGPGVVRVVTRP